MDTLGKWLLSVVESCPLLGDCLSITYMYSNLIPFQEGCPL